MTKIAVHNGAFHADDSLAAYLLLNTKEFADSEIIRTRDPDVINECDVVADVGGIYDRLLQRYDHHQTTFSDTFPGSSIPMSSCGLVYYHYGEEVIQNLCKKLNLTIEEEDIEFTYKYLYFHFVQEIDAQDNGINPSQEKPSYTVSSDITHRISRLNPHWKIENPDYDAAFQEAIKLIGNDFEFFLTYTIKYSISNYKIAKDAYENRFDFDPSGLLLNLPKYFPVEDFLDILENKEKKVLYCIYGRIDENKNKSWAVRTINTDKPFESRKPLPFPGVNSQEMEEKTGIEGLIFAHKNPFLAVFKTKEQALQYAKFAANYNPTI